MNGDWRHKKAEEEEAQADMAAQKEGGRLVRRRRRRRRRLAIFISAVVQSVRDARAWGHGHFSKNCKSQGLSLSFCAHGDERGDSISALLIETRWVFMNM